MTQWTGKRAIVKKYQISPKELLHIISKGEVTYSNIDGVLLVDGESFAAYIDALKQVRQKDNIVNRLKRAIRCGGQLELDKAESFIAYRLEERINSIYSVATHALGALLEPQERRVFLAFADGDDICSIARQMGLQKEAVFYMFENSIEQLDKQAPHIIQQLAVRCQAVEAVNDSLVLDLSQCNCQLLECEGKIGMMQAKIDSLQRKEEYLNASLSHADAMYKQEREAYVLLEELNRESGEDVFSFIKDLVVRFLHFKNRT